jgi:ABC-2 type transport system permease protein
MNPALSRLRLWWAIFRVSLEERLVYRGDFAFGTLMRFLPMLTQIFLWWAIFDAMAGRPTAELPGSAPVATADATDNSDSPVAADDVAATENAATETGPAESVPGPRDISEVRIKGYNLNDMIAYMLLVMLARAFSSMPGLTSGIASSIQKGEVKKFLIQPVDMLGSLLLQRIAHKLVYYVIAFFPFALVFFLCRSYFEAGFPSPSLLAAVILSLVGAFLLGFAIEACLGLVAFWLLEVSSLAFIFMLLSFFLSGHMFPLDLMPAPLDWMIGLLPFQYLAYFPSAVALGKIQGEALVTGLIVQFLWVLVFGVLCRILWHRGLIRYGGYGG